MRPSRFAMDSLIVSAVRPTVHVENGFVDCQRGPSDLQIENGLDGLPAKSVQSAS